MATKKPKQQTPILAHCAFTSDEVVILMEGLHRVPIGTIGNDRSPVIRSAAQKIQEASKKAVIESTSTKG